MKIDLKTDPYNCKACIYKDTLFNKLNAKDLDLIDQNKKEIEFKRGEIICEEGTEIKSFMYLKNGLVKLFKSNLHDKDQIVSIAKPLDFISFLSLFSRSTYKFSICALEDTIVCAVDLEALKKVIQGNGKFALEILYKMSKMFDEIIEARFEINRKHLRGRIAYILLYFSKHIYQSNNFHMPISRREIAELIQMTTENVIRILSEFRKDGIIKIDGKQVHLLEPERLESICKLG